MSMNTALNLSVVEHPYDHTHDQGGNTMMVLLIFLILRSAIQ